MPTLTDGTSLNATITLSKATGTIVTLDTDKKYITKDIELTINAPTTSASANGATVSYGTGWITGGSTTVTDSNLTAENIRKGITIFGVTGSLTGGSLLISDTTDTNGGTIRTITTTEDPLYLEPLNVTTNGTYTPDENHYYSSVSVNVTNTGSLQAKTNISPTESSQTITPDSGYTGLSSVQINAISSTYVGSGITQCSSSSLTASGATVTVPAGYYASQATKSVTTMTLPTSAASSATSGYTSKATISRSTSAQYINIPSGYNSAGGYYTISATPNGTATAPSSISGTSATVTTGTNTLTLTKTISVTPSITTAGYISSGTAGDSSVSLTASVTTKAAATITPSTSDQTIASGTYLTGTQTISGDANLVASNIISGKTIFGVAGSVVIQHYYTGTGTPSSSIGVDGDIYLKTS